MVGGQLTPAWLLAAYRRGIFPWPIPELTDVPLWWSPDPRAVIELDRFHISRRLLRRLRSGRFRVTCDREFVGVVHACAEPRGEEGGSWITPAMVDAYTRLFELGHCHSVEVWDEDRLVGGVYGVRIGGLFAGESMFRRERDASKVALAYLVEHLKTRGFALFDIQQWTPHTGSLGAIEISRTEYVRRLRRAVELPVEFGTGPVEIDW